MYDIAVVIMFGEEAVFFLWSVRKPFADGGWLVGFVGN